MIKEITKARLDRVIKYIFEGNIEEVDEVICERYGIEKEELSPGRYKKEEVKDNKGYNFGDFDTSKLLDSVSKDGIREDTNLRDKSEERIKKDKIIQIGDIYKKENSLLKEGTESNDKIDKAKLLMELIENDLGNYTTLEIELDLDIYNPEDIYFKVLSKETILEVEFGVDYIYDKTNGISIYENGKYEDKLNLYNNELREIIELYKNRMS